LGSWLAIIAGVLGVGAVAGLSFLEYYKITVVGWDGDADYNAWESIISLIGLIMLAAGGLIMLLAATRLMGASTRPFRLIGATITSLSLVVIAVSGFYWPGLTDTAEYDLYGDDVRQGRFIGFYLIAGFALIAAVMSWIAWAKTSPTGLANGQTGGGYYGQAPTGPTAYNQPNSNYAQPTESYNQTAPYNQTTGSYNQTAPYNQPAGGYSQPNNQPNPGYGPPPAANPPAPSYGPNPEPPPGYGQPPAPSGPGQGGGYPQPGGY
jgi:hypothetical protein